MKSESFLTSKISKIPTLAKTHIIFASLKTNLDDPLELLVDPLLILVDEVDLEHV